MMKPSAIPAGNVDMHTHVVPAEFPSYLGHRLGVRWPSMAEAAIAIDKNLREKMVPGDEYIYYGN